MIHARWPFLVLAIVFILVLTACGSSTTEPGRDLGVENDDDVALTGDDDTTPATDDDSQSDDDTTVSDDDTAASDDDTSPPPACLVPTVGMVINTDAVICPGTYQLDAGNGPAITIDASDIQIVGDGVVLEGDAVAYGSAFDLSQNGLQNVTVSGFTIKNFYYGFFGWGSFTNIQFLDLDIEEPAGEPLDIGALDGGVCRQVILDRITVVDSRTTGITLRDCTQSAIRHVTYSNETVNVIESNFILGGGSDNVIEDNSVYTRNEAGCNAVWLDGSNNNLIQNNLFDLGYKDGSHLADGSSDNVYYHNTFIMRNNQYLFYIPADCQRNEIYGNRFVGGHVEDEAPNTIFCVDGVGNSYENGANYGGPDPNGGMCP